MCIRIHLSRVIISHAPFLIGLVSWSSGLCKNWHFKVSFLRHYYVIQVDVDVDVDVGDKCR